jgi:uncharacterized protein YaiI (UPF0178 family)
VTRWIVDASNVIGARPDGWWRDRTGATRRLLAALEARDEDVVLVLDADPSGLAGRHGRVEVVAAARRGRDAADDAIVARLSDEADPSSWCVVTSDRALADRVRSLGASVLGAGAYRSRLDSD